MAITSQSAITRFAGTSIALAELPEALAKPLTRHPMVPATVEGRLVVDARHQRQGRGNSCFSTPDAKDEEAAHFYQRFGFRFLAAGTPGLFMPMIEIARLFSQPPVIPTHLFLAMLMR